MGPSKKRDRYALQLKEDANWSILTKRKIYQQTKTKCLKKSIVCNLKINSSAVDCSGTFIQTN